MHRYTYAEQIWNFLRYDRSNKSASENESPSVSSLGPVSLYKWPDPKVDSAEEKTVLNGMFLFSKNPIEQLSDNLTKTLDDKNPKKTAASLHPTLSRDSTVIKSASIKENRTSKIFHCLKYQTYRFSWCC